MKKQLHVARILNSRLLGNTLDNALAHLDTQGFVLPYKFSHAMVIKGMGKSRIISESESPVEFESEAEAEAFAKYATKTEPYLAIVSLHVQPQIPEEFEESPLKLKPREVNLVNLGRLAPYELRFTRTMERLQSRGINTGNISSIMGFQDWGVHASVEKVDVCIVEKGAWMGGVTYLHGEPRLRAQLISYLAKIEGDAFVVVADGKHNEMETMQLLCEEYGLTPIVHR